MLTRQSSQVKSAFMARGTSKGDDNQRGKAAEKKPVSSDQSRVDEADVSSSKAPSRVHIFTNKSPRRNSSEPDDEKLQCSSVKANRPEVSPHRDTRASTFVEVRSPVVGFKDELVRLGHQIEKGKKALYEAAMKLEDLDAIMQGLRRTREGISKKRQQKYKPMFSN